ncbi:flagellar basal body L-ring protein FlgH [Vibrio sagamiensis]|uniref:Flagellar L-ring protein n=1 Tax=Vibrio sagamiensis NBRC 104589 TaxID=1219064 RepID=A0A511QHT7_9VIBR|nr:flagellar L-ring protein 1 [Vibrio sagamiensis NBRC 104589]
MIQRLSFMILAAALSGCSMIGDKGNGDTEQATTSIDAVEGDKSQVGSSSITDMFRGRKDPVVDDPAWAPIHPSQKTEHYAAETGSLFSTEHISDLYDDSKPRGVGDIITVTLDETTSATKSANADLSKSNDSTMEPLAVGGQEMKLGKYNFSYDLNSKNTFAGDSSAKQSNSISGYISVEVVEVLANGNLVIRGEKWMTLNTGDEYIRLSGTIRPDDISFDNTIASNRVSNARIQYSGTGMTQDTQQPGFLARFFNVAL